MTKRPRWRWRVLAPMAVLMTSGLWALPTSPVAASGVDSPASAPMTLVSQSASVGPGGVYHIRLKVSPSSGGEKLQVAVWSRLTTRSSFDASLTGRMRGNQIYATQPLTLAQLAADSSGIVDIGLPVDTPASTNGIPSFQARVDSAGLYPVQVRLYSSAGVPVGAPMTTYMLYAPSSGGLPRLAVALIVQVHAPVTLGPGARPTQLPAATSRALAAVASALGTPGGAPVTLELTPQTIETLAAGSPRDRATAAVLAKADPADQVLPATYVPLPQGAMAASALDREVTAQLAAGTAALAETLGRTPETGAWVTSDALDPATLDALVARGFTRVVAPDHDLSPAPTDYRKSTFAQPAQLATRVGEKGPGVLVWGADDGLGARFVNGADQVLAANHLLAELSMIQLETPADRRGVAVMPPPGWRPDPAFLSALLTGLQKNSLLDPVTVDALFATVPAARVGSAPVVRSLLASHPPAPDQAAVAAWRSARRQLDGLRSMVRSGGRVDTDLGHQLLISESADLNTGQRQAVLATVTGPIRGVESRITLPGPFSVTLTARDGNVPLTVLSDPALAAQVQLRLTSQKLTFRPFAGPWGRCQAPAATSLVCDLTLTSPATTLKVPVEARASGAFALVVSMVSPDGSVTLATNRDTVRSTVFSGVGVVLMVVAGLSLAVWWIGNARHGRRARQLVVPPHDLGEEELLGSPPPPALGAAVGARAGLLPGAPAEPGVEGGTDGPEIGQLFATTANATEDPKESPAAQRASPSVSHQSPN